MLFSPFRTPRNEGLEVIDTQKVKMQKNTLSFQEAYHYKIKIKKEQLEIVNVYCLRQRTGENGSKNARKERKKKNK